LPSNEPGALDCLGDTPSFFTSESAFVAAVAAVFLVVAAFVFCGADEVSDESSAANAANA
jgi:hypothetical protein